MGGGNRGKPKMTAAGARGNEEEEAGGKCRSSFMAGHVKNVGL